MKNLLVLVLLLSTTLLRGEPPGADLGGQVRSKPPTRERSGADLVVTNGLSLAEGLRLSRKIGTEGNLTDFETKRAFCAVSFVVGFYAGCSVWRNYGSDTPCLLPDNVNALQFQKIVEKWLLDHPESLHKNAGYLMMLALRDAFPNPSYRRPDSRTEGL